MKQPRPYFFLIVILCSLSAVFGQPPTAPQYDSAQRVATPKFEKPPLRNEFSIGLSGGRLSSRNQTFFRATFSWNITKDLYLDYSLGINTGNNAEIPVYLPMGSVFALIGVQGIVTENALTSLAVLLAVIPDGVSYKQKVGRHTSLVSSFHLLTLSYTKVRQFSSRRVILLNNDILLMLGGKLGVNLRYEWENLYFFGGGHYFFTYNEFFGNGMADVGLGYRF